MCRNDSYSYFYDCLCVEMTAELAKQLNVRHLIMTHFSQRYRPLSYEIKVICVSQHFLHKSDAAYSLTTFSHVTSDHYDRF